MNTSTFLARLRAHSNLPLAFRAGRETVNPGYHLTEVKRVSYETMDCGAMTHRWSETQFEVWVPAVPEATPERTHMRAEKFLQIIDRVAAKLPLENQALARIHASFSGQPAALYEIDEVTPRGGELVVTLSPDRTRCKAAERRRNTTTAGCCGSETKRNDEQAGRDCGCGTQPKEPAAVCCA